MNEKDFVKAIEKSRELIKSGKFTECPCSQVRCEWHGRCFECVMIHRVKKKHVPECLQSILSEKIAELAKVVELDVTDARPVEKHWDYLYKISPPR